MIGFWVRNFLVAIHAIIEFGFICEFTRVQGKANVVFYDGHVESPTLKFLFEDTNDAALVRWSPSGRPPTICRTAKNYYRNFKLRSSVR